MLQLSPVPASHEFIAPAPPPPVPPPLCADVPRRVDAVTWSPGLWWLLHRYEYLFEALLPEKPAEEIVLVEPGCSSPERTSDPHWADSKALNPPPAAATLPPPSPGVNDSSGAAPPLPVLRGAFVDVVV